MAKKITAIRGMNDVLPTDSVNWQYIETQFQQVALQYGYRQIRTPILESTDLFHRAIGEVTDIVEKETYTFDDRNGDSLTLRPEGTAGVVRAGLEHGLFYNQTQRLWYCGPFFRHERPQKGRYRQFYQIGVEAFGMPGVDIDLELLLLTWRFWCKLEIEDKLTLEINTLGSKEERAEYRKLLIEYLEKHLDELDEDSKRRLYSNPLRILDSKNPAMQDMLCQAPKLLEYLGSESKAKFDALRAGLDAADIPYRVNPRLVRGMDYYCHAVFEWISDDLGAQATVCAGGRYDALVEEIGNQNVPAVGFAMGIERLLLILQHFGLSKENQTDIYMISSTDDKVRQASLMLAEQLRNQLPSITITTHCGAGKLKAQFKKADTCGTRLALILGEDELENNTISIKDLTGEVQQKTVALYELIDTVTELLK